MVTHPARSTSAVVKEKLLRGASAALAAYFRYMPTIFLKKMLWKRVVRPYIIWRRVNIIARSKFGARFDGSFPDMIHSFLFFFGVWEPAITSLYYETLKPGDIVVDVGANVGAHVLLASHLVGPTGQVHAVEASPSIYARLQQNLILNSVTNVTAHNRAATAQPELVTVYLHESTNYGATTIIPGEAIRRSSAPEAKIEGLPLPDIVSQLVITEARLIKIDVEGAEWLVLQGMREALPRLSLNTEILVEVCPDAFADFGVTVEDFINIFFEAGYRAFEVNNRYDPDAYIEGLQCKITPLRGPVTRQADLLFSRKR